jgi:uncharacterized small protein (DUF1192 family)
MDEPVEPRRTRGWALGELAREDLDLFGQAELQERIEALQAEIGRCQAQIGKNARGRAAADALFSLKGDEV